MTETLWCVKHDHEPQGKDNPRCVVGFISQVPNCVVKPMLLVPKNAPSITVTPRGFIEDAYEVYVDSDGRKSLRATSAKPGRYVWVGEASAVGDLVVDP